VLLVLRWDVDGALPEPGRWGDEWKAPPLMTVFRGRPVTCTQLIQTRSDQIRVPNRYGAVLCSCVCWRQRGPTWVFNPRLEGSYLLAEDDIGRMFGDRFVLSCFAGSKGAGLWRMAVSYAVETRTERESTRFKASRRCLTVSRLPHY
jgi:hypothetical protein